MILDWTEGGYHIGTRSELMNEVGRQVFFIGVDAEDLLCSTFVRYLMSIKFVS